MCYIFAIIQLLVEKDLIPVRFDSI